MPNFTGKWKVSLEKSKASKQMLFECSTTGEDGHSRWNGQRVRGKALWQDDELIIASWMRFGNRELYFRDCQQLSDDEKPLVMERRDDALAGQLTVFEREFPTRICS